MKFFLKTIPNYFRTGDIIKWNTDTYGKNKGIVLSDNCKDRWWRKLLRFFGFKIFNPTGYIKIKILKNII